MKRPFSFLDSGYLLHRFEEWQEETNRIVSRSDYLQQAIREAAEHCIAAEMMAVLRDIPVEEVNRDRHGIRVKVLRQVVLPIMRSSWQPPNSSFLHCAVSAKRGCSD